MYSDSILEGAFRIPHDVPPRYLLVYTAYLDESGQEQDDWMFVAGFFGPEDAWKALPEPWLKAIAPRNHLHVKRQKFTKETVRQMLEKAGPIAVNCGLTPMLGGVRQGDYMDLLSGTRDGKLLNGYVNCCSFAVINAMRSLPPGERLEVVFEQQQRYGWMNDISMQVIADFSIHPQLVLPDGRSRLASWRSVPKGTTLLTEPADYFAFSLLQLWRDQNSRKTKWCRPMLDACQGKAVGKIMRRNEIRAVTILGLVERVLNDVQAGRQPFVNQDEYEAFDRAMKTVMSADSRMVESASKRDE
jgi:hypothetical protein